MVLKNYWSPLIILLYFLLKYLKKLLPRDQWLIQME